MFVQSNNNMDKNMDNNKKSIERLSDGKYKVPTAGYYAKFESSKVD